MKKAYLFPLLVLLVSSLALSSCKKEEEEKDYMTGSVSFEFPQYCLVGATIDAFCTGITDPVDVTYFWISSTLLGADTLFSQQATFNIPDSAGSYIVSAHARADGYYSSTMAATVIAIDPDINEGSITGVKESEFTFEDERDGRVYQYVKIGKLDWMSENLAYGGTEENPVGVGFYKEDVLRDIFGSLYSWNDATGGESGSGLGQGPQGVCPQGWSIPTKADWEDLATTANSGKQTAFESSWDGVASHLVVDAYFNKTRMWPYAPKIERKNTYGWNALPCGHCTDNYNRFRHLLEYGMWWCSEDDGDKGLYRYIYYNAGTMPYHAVDKADFAASVRCVRLTN